MPTTLITGANRGLGLEFTRQYAQSDWDVIACCRNPDDAADLQSVAEQLGNIRIERLDVADHAAIDALASRLAGQAIDVLLNNAGIIGPVPIPEHIGRQHFGQLDYDLWAQVLRINTFGPVKMAEAFLSHVAASEQKKIVSLSSTVGSLVERDTAAFAYASSKTALNKSMRLLAATLKDRGIIVSMVCPGYVKTRMDFGTADVEIPESVAGVRKLIDEFSLADSGTFRRYNGDVVAW